MNSTIVRSFQLDVSVVIASWNAAVFLPRAISSALNQEGVALEVIVCDDASMDETEKLMLEMTDPRVRYIRLDVNSGPSAARNAGLTAATGEWVLILDADDLMEPDRAAQMIELGRRTGADIIADNLQLVGSNGDPLRLLIDEALDGAFEEIDLETYILRNLSGQYGIGYLKPLLRRRFLVDHEISYRNDLRIGEDFAIVCDMLTARARFLRMRTAFYRYTIHDGSTSHRINLRHLESMIRYDSEWLVQNADSVGQSARLAMDAHLSDLKRLRAFNGMVFDIKEKRVISFLRSALRNPRALVHFKAPLLARIERLRARRVKPVGREAEKGAFS